MCIRSCIGFSSEGYPHEDIEQILWESTRGHERTSGHPSLLYTIKRGFDIHFAFLCIGESKGVLGSLQAPDTTWSPLCLTISAFCVDCVLKSKKMKTICIFKLHTVPMQSISNVPAAEIRVAWTMLRSRVSGLKDTGSIHAVHEVFPQNTSCNLFFQEKA